MSRSREPSLRDRFHPKTYNLFIGLPLAGGWRDKARSTSVIRWVWISQYIAMPSPDVFLMESTTHTRLKLATVALLRRQGRGQTDDTLFGGAFLLSSSFRKKIHQRDTGYQRSPHQTNPSKKESHWSNCLSCGLLENLQHGKLLGVGWTTATTKKTGQTQQTCVKRT